MIDIVVFKGSIINIFKFTLSRIIVKTLQIVSTLKLFLITEILELSSLLLMINNPKTEIKFF